MNFIKIDAILNIPTGGERMYYARYPPATSMEGSALDYRII